MNLLAQTFQRHNVISRDTRTWLVHYILLETEFCPIGSDFNSLKTHAAPPHTGSPTCTLSEDHQTFTVSYGSHAQRGPVSLTRGTGRLGPYQTALFQTSPSCFQQRKSNDLNANKCSASQQLCDL